MQSSNIIWLKIARDLSKNYWVFLTFQGGGAGTRLPLNTPLGIQIVETPVRRTELYKSCVQLSGRPGKDKMLFLAVMGKNELKSCQLKVTIFLVRPIV